MGTIIVFVVLGTLFGKWINKKKTDWHFGDSVWFIFFLLGILCTFIIGSKVSVKEVITQRIELQPFETAGYNYILGQAKIGEVSNYYGVALTDGSNEIIFMPVDDSEMVQDLEARQDGYVVKTTTNNHMPQKWMAWFFINSLSVNNLNWYEIHLSRNGVILFS